eukprot:1143357-Pyramimonas_sp.AAC.1
MVGALDCFSPLRETARSSPAQVPGLGDSVSTRYAASTPCRPRWAATWAYEGCQATLNNVLRRSPSRSTLYVSWIRAPGSPELPSRPAPPVEPEDSELKL